MLNDTTIFLISAVAVVSILMFYGFIIYVACAISYSNGRLDCECTSHTEPRLRTWYDAPLHYELHPASEQEVVQDEP